jgi:hypothetical protein
MWKVILLGLTLGAAVSGLSLPLTGQREAFDASPAYYLCAVFLAGALATLPAPRFWWLAVVAVFLGEHIYYAAAYPDMRPWFLFGLLINAILPTWWATATGALLVYLGARVAKQCPPSRRPDPPREDRS